MNPPPHPTPHPQKSPPRTHPHTHTHTRTHTQHTTTTALPQALLDRVPDEVLLLIGDRAWRARVKPQTISNLAIAYAHLRRAPQVRAPRTAALRVAGGCGSTWLARARNGRLPDRLLPGLLCALHQQHAEADVPPCAGSAARPAPHPTTPTPTPSPLPAPARC